MSSSCEPWPRLRRRAVPRRLPMKSRVLKKKREGNCCSNIDNSDVMSNPPHPKNKPHRVTRRHSLRAIAYLSTSTTNPQHPTPHPQVPQRPPTIQNRIVLYPDGESPTPTSLQRGLISSSMRRPERRGRKRPCGENRGFSASGCSGRAGRGTRGGPGRKPRSSAVPLWRRVSACLRANGGRPGTFSQSNCGWETLRTASLCVSFE